MLRTLWVFFISSLSTGLKGGMVPSLFLFSAHRSRIYHHHILHTKPTHMKPTTSITLTLPAHDLSMLTTWLVLVSEGIISDEGEALLSASDLESLHAIQKTADLWVLNFAGAARVINTDAIDDSATTDYGQVH